MKKSYLLGVACTLAIAYAPYSNSAILETRAQLQSDWLDFSSNASNSSVVGPSTVSLTSSHAFGGGFYDGAASATATYGTLRASATATLTDYLVDYYFGCLDDLGLDCFGGIPATASAVFRDTLTISNLQTDGLLHVSFSVDRTISSSASVFAGGIVSVLGGTGINADDDRVGFSNSGSDTVDLVLPVTSGVPLIFAAGLSLNVNFNNVSGIFSGSASADFSNTVTLTEFLVTDLNNNPLTGINIQSESGTIYAVSPLNTIPIPSAVWLFGSGLIGLIGVARRKAHV